MKHSEIKQELDLKRSAATVKGQKPVVYLTCSGEGRHIVYGFCVRPRPGELFKSGDVVWWHPSLPEPKPGGSSCFCPECGAEIQPRTKFLKEI